MADEVYSQLPPHIKARIDDTFYALLAQSRGLDQGGSGGGFIPEPQAHDDEAQIPLDLVPSALGRLNLPDDDDEVLTVFRNAASGWKGGSYTEDVGMSVEGGGDYELGVSLEDWRSVCAVLLEDGDEDVEMEVGEGGFVRDDGEKGGAYGGGGGFIREDEDENDDDAYHDDDDDEGEESGEGTPSDEDFIPGPRTRRTRGTARNRSPAATSAKAQRSSDSNGAEAATKLTAKQKQAAFDTFALFFPDVKEEELKGKRVMIKDVQRVAALLKEKIKAEEFIDMLEMFSTSPDKSMSYDDFLPVLLLIHVSSAPHHGDLESEASRGVSAGNLSVEIETFTSSPPSTQVPQTKTAGLHLGSQLPDAVSVITPHPPTSASPLIGASSAPPTPGFCKARSPPPLRLHLQFLDVATPDTETRKKLAMTVPNSLSLTPSTTMVKPLPKRRPTRVDDDDVEVRRIEGKLNEEEVDKVTEVLVEAFADDPFSLHLVGGNMDLNPTQLRSVVGAANVGGVIVVGLVPSTSTSGSQPRGASEADPQQQQAGSCEIETGEKSQIDGEIAGVMIFDAPGQSLNSTKEQREAGYNQFLEAVDEETRGWWLEYWNPLLARTCTTAFGKDTALHAWDLHLFGVRPSFHGKGVASKMLQFARSWADADEAPMTLQTQNEVNVQMYERKGFEVKERIEMESRQGKSQFWFLLREPAGKRDD